MAHAPDQRGGRHAHHHLPLVPRRGRRLQAAPLAVSTVGRGYGREGGAVGTVVDGGTVAYCKSATVAVRIRMQAASRAVR